MTRAGSRLGDLASGPLAVSLDELLARHPRLALAVSGGSDSVALMHLVAARARRHTALFDAVTIVTVDHRLRPGSAAEAERVAVMARDAGFAHHAVLAWSGPRPETGIQAAAREARYRLIGDFCSANGIAAFATAHTRDDQAETVLMRLARGSGIDGLAGMSPARQLGNLVQHRPLLDIARADLRTWLVSIGASWIDDPSNDNPAFERIRWRQARTALDDLGLSDKAVALTASRAARARAALDWAAAREIEQAGEKLALSPLGFARLSRSWLAGLPGDIRLRIVGSLVEAYGGQGTPPPLSSLEAACDDLCNSSAAAGHGVTLHGAMICRFGEQLMVLREPIGRRRHVFVPERIGHMPLTPGTSAVWDGRFQLTLDARAPEPAVVGPLGTEGLTALRRAKIVKALDGPARVLVSLPAVSFVRAGLAVPHLDVFPPHIGPAMVQVRSLGVPLPGGPIVRPSV